MKIEYCQRCDRAIKPNSRVCTNNGQTLCEECYLKTVVPPTPNKSTEKIEAQNRRIKDKKRSKNIATLIALAIIVSIVIWAYQSSNQTSTRPVHNKTVKEIEKPQTLEQKKEKSTDKTAGKVQRSIEHNLAIIHEGWEVPEDHTTVLRFRYLLQELESRCIQSKQEIGDMTVSTREYIRKERGIKMNLLSMMVEMNETIKVGYPEGKVDYAQLIALQGVFWMHDYD
jgi:hypothetical protein